MPLVISFLFASFLSSLVPVFALADGGVQTASPTNAMILVQPMERAKVGSSIADLRLKTEKMFPENEWKTVGFCDYKKDPLATVRIPKFISWDPHCSYHMVKDGVEYCGPDDSSAKLEGSVTLEGKEHIFQIGMDAFRRKEKGPTGSYSAAYNAAYGDYGAILETGMKVLDGKEVSFVEVEDVNGKLPRPTKILSRIDFLLPYLNGKLIFVEMVKDGNNMAFVKHKERIFQSFIDKIVASFKFKVPTDKPAQL